MSPLPGISAAGSTPPADERARLKQTAQQLEAAFYEQMLKALRATVPEGGSTSPGSRQAGDMFTDLLDQQVSEDLAARQGPASLGQAIYRQLARDAGWSISGSGDSGSTSGGER